MASQKNIDILENSLLAYGRPGAVSNRLGLFGGKGNLGGLVGKWRSDKKMHTDICMHILIWINPYAHIKKQMMEQTIIATWGKGSNLHF